jgi:prepilin-type N-terminal cleavage/methylation domain-containing protein
MRTTRSGFTLVELLIVISIIAVLAAIVLVALGSGRQTASNTGVKTYVNDVQEAAAVYMQNNGSYGMTYPSSVCPTAGSSMFTDPDIQSFISALNAKNGNKTKCATGTALASGNATSFAIASPVSYSSQYWCVDSTGTAKLSDTGDIYTQIFAYIIQTVYAFVPPSGPNLGGGIGTAALCP